MTTGVSVERRPDGSIVILERRVLRAGMFAAAVALPVGVAATEPGKSVKLVDERRRKPAT